MPNRVGFVVKEMMNSRNNGVDFKVLPQLLVALAANGGAFIFGILLGWSAPVGPEITNKDYEFPITTNEFAWIVSLMGLGGACSSILSGIVMRKLGIKRTILVFNIPILAAWIILIFARSPVLLMIARFLSGITGGCYCYVLPIYVGEISSKEIRGSLLSLFQAILYVGILFVFVTGYFVNALVLNIICAIVTIIYTGIICVLPESPIYLLGKNDIDKTKATLRLLRGDSYDFESELMSLKKQQEEMSTEKKSFLELFKSKATMRAFTIIITLAFFFQMTGINAILFYSTKIFIEAGVQLDPQICTIIIGCAQILGTLFATAFVDRLGRKIILMCSMVLMFASLIGIGVFFSVKDGGSSVENLGWLPVTSLSVFIIAFSGGMGPMFYVLLGELFSNDAKDVVAPIGQVLNFTLTFVIGLVFPFLTEAIGTGTTFYAFAGFAVFAFLFTVFFIPETKGKSLHEIQILLTK